MVTGERRWISKFITQWNVECGQNKIKSSFLGCGISCLTCREQVVPMNSLKVWINCCKCWYKTISNSEFLSLFNTVILLGRGSAIASRIRLPDGSDGTGGSNNEDQGPGSTPKGGGYNL